MITSMNFGNEIMQYEHLLRPFAINLTKSYEESEDLIQDTFYRALANRDKFSQGTNIKAWLFTIMRNIFINNYRRNKKSNTITDTSENQYLLNSTTVTETNTAGRTLIAEDIDNAMKEVSKDFTEPFMMYFKGYKYQEISEKLDLPLGTVKSRIFFARKELQERLKSRGIVNSAV